MSKVVLALIPLPSLATVTDVADLGGLRIDLLSDSTLGALDTYDVTGIALEHRHHGCDCWLRARVW